MLFPRTQILICLRFDQLRQCFPLIFMMNCDHQTSQYYVKCLFVEVRAMIIEKVWKANIRKVVSLDDSCCTSWDTPRANKMLEVVYSKRSQFVSSWGGEMWKIILWMLTWGKLKINIFVPFSKHSERIIYGEASDSFLQSLILNSKLDRPGNLCKFCLRLKTLSCQFINKENASSSIDWDVRLNINLSPCTIHHGNFWTMFLALLLLQNFQLSFPLPLLQILKRMLEQVNENCRAGSVSKASRKHLSAAEYWNFLTESILKARKKPFSWKSEMEFNSHQTFWLIKQWIAWMRIYDGWTHKGTKRSQGDLLNCLEKGF